MINSSESFLNYLQSLAPDPDVAFALPGPLLPHRWDAPRMFYCSVQCTYALLDLASLQRTKVRLTAPQAHALGVDTHV